MVSDMDLQRALKAEADAEKALSDFIAEVLTLSQEVEYRRLMVSHKQAVIVRMQLMLARGVR